MMRIIVAVTLLLAAGASASFFDDEGDSRSHASLDFKDLTDVTVTKVNPLIITPPVVTAGKCPYAKFFKAPADTPAFSISSKVLDASEVPFEPVPNYLQMVVNFTYVEPVYKLLNASVPGPIISRGESHITVITPPEFDGVLKLAGVTIEEVNKIALDYNIQSSKFCITCVGKVEAPIGANGKYEQSYSIIVYSNDLITIRQKVWELYVSKGGYPSRFSAANIFGSHITLGFTQRDMFETDGVYKFDNACWSSIKLTD